MTIQLAGAPVSVHRDLNGGRLGSVVGSRWSNCTVTGFSDGER